jgi:hypothetical protein
MLRFRLLSLVCLLAAPSFVACVNDAQVEETAESEDGLRALSSSELLGDIAFDTPVSVAHSGTPKYRAYSFNVTQGDKLDIWVKSANADAHAWLLDDRFQTLKWNNDANGNEAEDDGTTDSNIKHTVSRTGKYYVAFRGSVGVAANFTVQVNRTTNQPPPPPPPPTGNPWGCSGTPLTNADLLARIPTGSDTVSLMPATGTLVYERRERTCNQQTGCGTWSTPAAIQSDGTFSKLAVTMTAAGAANLVVVVSDSNATYSIVNGAVTSNSHHTPTHDTGAYEAQLTSTCFGSRVKQTLGTNGQGTWTEVEWGARTNMPSKVTRPPVDDSNPWECGGAPLSQADILRRFPSGTDTLDVIAGQSAHLDVRTRTCTTQTGCAPWSALAPQPTDGVISTLKVITTSSNGLNLNIVSSDSNSTYNIASGTFTSNSHHTPSHDTGSAAGSITNGCIGYRIKMKGGQSGSGSWNETEWGYKGSFPAPIR